MESKELKLLVANQIRWGSTFLDPRFSRATYPFHYFFETPLLGRPDVARELERLLSPNASGEIVVSLGYERNGDFDESISELTTWRSNDGRPFTGKGMARYREHAAVGTWEGLLVASSSSNNWILFEDPAEPVAVLATQRSLSSFAPDPDLVFDVTRFMEIIDSPSIAFTDDAKRRFRESYAVELHG